MEIYHLVDEQVTEPGLQLPFSTEHPGPIAALSVHKWPLPLLIDFIVDNHHVYVTHALPKIMDLLEKVVTEYGLQHRELEEVFRSFHSLASHFSGQMRKEELVLFPVIKELVTASRNHKDLAYFPFEPLQAMIEEIEKDHSLIEEGLVRLRQLTNNFAVPVYACQSFRVLYQWLEQLEKDIYQHEYLENTFLFPKAIALEDSMR
jgi:regulator of cell morphogenesis and NO signaling